MRSNERWWIALCAAALLAASPRPSSATGAEDDAKTLFAQGRELRKQGKCAEAVIVFRKAIQIYPEGLGALRNVAECEEELGLFAAARRDWWDLRRAALQSNEAKYEGWEADAETRYRALEPKVARLSITLGGAEPQDVQVLLDGKPVDPRLVGSELERDLGAHTVEVHYGGAAPLSRRIELVEGEREAVTMTVPAGAPGPGAPGAPAGPRSDAATAPKAGSGATRTAGFVALGVGGASAVAMGVMIGVRASALSAIEGCPDPDGDGVFDCPRSLEGDYDTGRTAALLANVFGGVAAAGIGAGVVLLLVGSSDPAPASTGMQRAQISVSATPGGGGAQLFVRF